MLIKKAVLTTSAIVISISANAIDLVDTSTGGFDYLYSTTLDGAAYPGPGDGYFSGSNPDGQVGDAIQFTQQPDPFIPGGQLDVDCLGGIGSCNIPTLPGSAPPNLLNPAGAVSAGILNFNSLQLDITSFVSGTIFTSATAQLELLSDGSDLEVSPGVWQYDASATGEAAAQFTDFTTPGLVDFGSSSGSALALVNALTIDMIKWRLEEVSPNSYVFTGETANGSLIGVSFNTINISTVVPFPIYSLWIMGITLLGLGAYTRKRLKPITSNTYR